MEVGLAWTDGRTNERANGEEDVEARENDKRV